MSCALGSGTAPVGLLEDWPESFFFLLNGFSGFWRKCFHNKRLHNAFSYAQMSIRMRLKLEWFRVALKKRDWVYWKATKNLVFMIPKICIPSKPDGIQNPPVTTNQLG